MSATFFPASRWGSFPARFAALRAAASSMSDVNSAAVKSDSFRKSRPPIPNDSTLACSGCIAVLDRLSFDGATHAARSTTASAEFGTDDLQHFDAVVA